LAYQEQITPKEALDAISQNRGIRNCRESPPSRHLYSPFDLLDHLQREMGVPPARAVIAAEKALADRISVESLWAKTGPRDKSINLAPALCGLYSFEKS
jgi:hypothetical protein